jgi:hypothetical protein
MSSMAEGIVDRVQIIIAGTSCKCASTLNKHRMERRNTLSSGQGSTSSTFVGLLRAPLAGALVRTVRTLLSHSNLPPC